MASQMNVATDSVMSYYFYVKLRQIFGSSYALILIRFLYRTNLTYSRRTKAKVVLFYVLHVCDTNNFITRPEKCLFYYSSL